MPLLRAAGPRICDECHARSTVRADFRFRQPLWPVATGRSGKGSCATGAPRAPTLSPAACSTSNRLAPRLPPNYRYSPHGRTGNAASQLRSRRRNCPRDEKANQPHDAQLLFRRPGKEPVRTRRRENGLARSRCGGARSGGTGGLHRPRQAALKREPRHHRRGQERAPPAGDDRHRKPGHRARETPPPLHSPAASAPERAMTGQGSPLPQGPRHDHG